MSAVRRFCALVACVLLAFATGVPAHAQSTTIRIGITQSDCCIQAYYAQELGYFARAGLNAEVVPFTSVSALAEAIAGGAIDIAISTPVQVAEAVSRGIPFRVIAAGGVVTTKTPSSALCVATGSPVRSAKDLAGQTIAVIGLKTTAEFGLREWLDDAHVDSQKTHIVEMPFSQMPASLARGAIGAAVISEPALTIAKAQGSVRVIGVPSDSIAPEYMVSLWFSTQSFIDSHPAAVKTFVSVIYQTARWANAHQDQSGAILSKYANVDPELLKKMQRVPYRDVLRISELQPVLDVAYKYGGISKPMTAAALIGGY